MYALRYTAARRCAVARLEALTTSLRPPTVAARATFATSAVARNAEADKEEPKSTARIPLSIQANYFEPLRRPVTHGGLPVCDLQLRSYSVRNLEFMADFAMRAAYYAKLPASGPVPLPKRVERWTVPRGNFVHKKSQENFERITYKRLIRIKDGHPETVELWLAFLKQHQYHGVGMKANVWGWDEIGVGKKMNVRLETLRDVPDPKWAHFGPQKSSETASMAQQILNSPEYRALEDMQNELPLEESAAAESQEPVPADETPESVSSETPAEFIPTEKVAETPAAEETEAPTAGQAAVPEQAAQPVAGPTTAEEAVAAEHQATVEPAPTPKAKETQTQAEAEPVVSEVAPAEAKAEADSVMAEVAPAQAEASLAAEESAPLATKGEQAPTTEAPEPVSTAQETPVEDNSSQVDVEMAQILAAAEEARLAKEKKEEVKAGKVAEKVETPAAPEPPVEVKVEDATAEETKTLEVKAEETEVAEVKAEETRVEQVKTETEVKAKVEEVKAEETKVAEVKAEETRVEQVKAETEVKTKVEEVKAEKAEAEEAKTEGVKAEETKADAVSTPTGVKTAEAKPESK